MAEMIARHGSKYGAKFRVAEAKLARLRTGDSDAIPALWRRKIQAFFRPARP
jgi:hypothetical protein